MFDIKKYELVDSFRILNPKLRGYFLMSNIARDPEYIAYTSPKLKVERFTRTKFFTTPWNDHKIYKINVFDNTRTMDTQYKPSERPNI